MEAKAELEEVAAMGMVTRVVKMEVEAKDVKVVATSVVVASVMEARVTAMVHMALEAQRVAA